MEISQGFRVASLDKRFSSDILLNEIPRRYSRMPEVEILLTAVHGRLVFLHDMMAALDVTQEASYKLREQYEAVMKSLIKLQRRKPLLERLAKNNITRSEIAGLHDRLDTIYAALGVPIDPDMRQWETGCNHQHQVFVDLFGMTSIRMLVESVRGDKKVIEAIMRLYRDVQDDPTEQLTEIKRDVMTRVQNYNRDYGLQMFPWFISIEELNFENDSTMVEVEEIQGTYGSVKRAKWTRTVIGETMTRNVMVKSLFQDAPETGEKDFLEHLVFWYNLPAHPNILQLLGGSHVSRPPYFVTDVAKTTIVEFLQQEENRHKFWPMFIQVAQGLQVLHSHKIVHGGLKGNNILVDDKEVPKLADFNHTPIRALSVGKSMNSHAVQALKDAPRWKPRESLLDDEPRFESDVYSLGMCMIETITGRFPFDYAPEDADELYILDDREVMDIIMHGESHRRPDGVSDEGWEFISKLCAVEYVDRLTLDQAIETMSTFTMSPMSVAMDEMVG